MDTDVPPSSSFAMGTVGWFMVFGVYGMANGKDGGKQ